MNDLITICVWSDAEWCYQFDLDNSFGYAKSDDYQTYDIPADLDESEVQAFVDTKMGGHA